jgi:multiple sugar transport system substrate-binding protein
MRVRKPIRVLLATSGICLAVTACGGDKEEPVARDTTCDGKLEETAHINVWFHVSENVSGERKTLRRQAAAFNASQDDVQVKLVTLPEGDYANQVRSAAATGNLPDLLDFDGPNLYNYAWSGKLKPIDSCLSPSLRADLLPSILEQGTYAGRMWGVGTFDSGLGLYVRNSVLERAGIRIPSGPADAWTSDEFTDILGQLREAGFRRPLDIALNYGGGEWNTYGFAPTVWSAGGDLIDRETYRTVDGFFNGPEAVEALTTLQRWAEAGYVDPNRDGEAWEQGRTPISWNGHWIYDPFTQAFPGDVTIVPLPDFGEGTRTGMGSWQWGITANTADGDAAGRFLAFAEGGPEHLYIRQLQDGTARPRPQTPAYPALSAAFSEAFDAIVIDGRPVKPTLDAAVRDVERDLAAHHHYKPTEP